jgi:hypothetical protein
MHMADMKTTQTGNEVCIKKYQPGHKALWDDFVRRSSKNGTLLHTRQYLQHNTLNTTKDASLLFFWKDKLIAVFPAVLEVEHGQLILNSHKYCTYGGLVAGISLSFSLVEKCILSLINYAKVEGISEMIIRQSPRVYHAYLSDEIDYALWKCGFQIKFRECELIMDLTREFCTLYHSSTKRNLAKALREGVVVRECHDFAEFWEILTVNLWEKHQVRPVHTLRQMQILRELVGDNHIKLFGSFLDQQMIGGVVLFIANDQLVHAQYFASDYDFRKYRPVDALVDHVAGWAKSEGFAYFNLGMATEAGGAGINDGLFRFKQGFGAKGTSRDTVHILFSKTEDPDINALVPGGVYRSAHR